LNEFSLDARELVTGGAWIDVQSVRTERTAGIGMDFLEDSDSLFEEFSWNVVRLEELSDVPNIRREI
jgi:hypothetical protein